MTLKATQIGAEGRRGIHDVFFRSLYNPQAGFSYLEYIEYRLKKEETSQEYYKHQCTPHGPSPAKTPAYHSCSFVGLDSLIKVRVWTTARRPVCMNHDKCSAPKVALHRVNHPTDGARIEVKGLLFSHLVLNNELHLQNFRERCQCTTHLSSAACSIPFSPLANKHALSLASAVQVFPLRATAAGLMAAKHIDCVCKYRAAEYGNPWPIPPSRSEDN